MTRLRLRVLAAAGMAALAAPVFSQDAARTGFEASLDRSADACTDFYQFACGGWMAKNPIPGDQARWGRFDELLERNRTTLRAILEEAAADKPGREAVDRMVGDYYASCMDEAGIEAKGTKPLAPLLQRVSAVSSTAEVAPLLAELHRQGVSGLFAFSSGQDFKDATQVIGDVDQGGMGLPDRDYYLKDDPKSAEIRKQYLTHLQAVFELLEEPKEKAARSAKTVLDVETALAKAALDRVSRRDPSKVYHKMTAAELEALAPSFSWKLYFGGMGVPGVTSLNVSVPDFVKGVDDLLKSTPLEDLKTYLRWHLAHVAAPFLPKAFVDANFEFYGRALTGQKEPRARWKRCVDYTDGDLGEALGRRYVEKTFGPEGKTRMKVMVDALFKSLEEDIRALPWMTDVTRKQALLKLGAVATKIGAPDAWRDYSALEIARGDGLGNSLRANRFEVDRQLGKIGKPVDRKEWGMSPPTVNAGYNPLMNDITFPAGILQPPFFDRAMDDAVNFGAIGAVIGHELTHGFDDQGRQFDANGNLKDWWTEADAKEFERRAGCIADQYGGYSPLADVKLNGRLTLGENVADNGGVRVAYAALLSLLAGRAPEPKDGLSAEQRFFVGWGQIWCQNQTEEVSRMLAQVDPHSPGRFRVNGVASNLPEFAKAFGCKAGQPMVQANACRVW
jgi:endothelin-converting enzyme/putative endopeptidase